MYTFLLLLQTVQKIYYIMFKILFDLKFSGNLRRQTFRIIKKYSVIIAFMLTALLTLYLLLHLLYC